MNASILLSPEQFAALDFYASDLFATTPAPSVDDVSYLVQFGMLRPAFVGYEPTAAGEAILKSGARAASPAEVREIEAQLRAEMADFDAREAARPVPLPVKFRMATYEEAMAKRVRVVTSYDEDDAVAEAADTVRIFRDHDVRVEPSAAGSPYVGRIAYDITRAVHPRSMTREQWAAHSVAFLAAHPNWIAA